MSKTISLVTLLKKNSSNNNDLLSQVVALLAAGADPNECVNSVTPIRTASYFGRFDVVKVLLEAGADSDHMSWTPLFHAVVHGRLPAVAACARDKSSLLQRDVLKRTPFLLAVQTGDIEIVSCLIEAGADLNDLGFVNKSALELAFVTDDAQMLSCLIAHGMSFDRFGSDGTTPLMQAAESGAVNCVRYLLELGADVHEKDRSLYFQETAINHASSIEILEMLVAAGGDFSHINDSCRHGLLGLERKRTLKVTEQEYLSQKHRVFGKENPQKCDIPFWYDMVRCAGYAWKAREHFDDTDTTARQAVWCYSRYGMSITSIGNGEYIEIGGEHEDSYDADFCIYNEVFHHTGDGRFTIYQYPREVFPPTDNHTATLVGDYVYIIGNFGYPKERQHGTTPVYRLDTQSFKIEKLETSGEGPGWIKDHSAELTGMSVIRIQGGEILEMPGEVEIGRLNTFDFELDVHSGQWSKHNPVPKSKARPFLPMEYKQFDHSTSCTFAFERNSKWHLLRVVSVDRVDVSQGQRLELSNEVVLAPSDDYLFVVAYSTSEPFDSRAALDQAVEEESWSIESLCTVCRTTRFPAEVDYVGYIGPTRKETEAFFVWKELFAQEQVGIN